MTCDNLGASFASIRSLVKEAYSGRVVTLVVEALDDGEGATGSESLGVICDTLGASFASILSPVKEAYSGSVETLVVEALDDGRRKKNHLRVADPASLDIF